MWRRWCSAKLNECQLKHFIRRLKRKEIAERLKHTAAFGDLKENAAYHEARDAQGFLEGRIMDLEAIIKDSIII
jgi:transcription elongation factor GreA